MRIKSFSGCFFSIIDHYCLFYFYFYFINHLIFFHLIFNHCNNKTIITFYFIIIIYFLSFLKKEYSNVTAGKGQTCVFWSETLINSGYLALNAADLANGAALNPSKMNFRVFNQTHLRISHRPNPAPGERVCISSPLLFLPWPSQYY